MSSVGRVSLAVLLAQGRQMGFTMSFRGEHRWFVPYPSGIDSTFNEFSEAVAFAEQFKATILLVDTIAMIQGVNDAKQLGRISSGFTQKIYDAVKQITYKGPVGRSVCNYDKLLVALAGVTPGHWAEASVLWKDHLGDSLASGITVAAN